MKRGESGLSLVVAVDKPQGMTSHDVVNRCRRIFGERRVGHAGTLDPLATGALPVCVGPATRLDRYITGHDKRYRVTMRFGFETTTDDCEGEPTTSAPVPEDLLDGAFAPAYVAGLVGEHEQVPPAYSAVKVDGKKAYEQARRGKDVHLEPRTVEVYESRLVERSVEGGSLTWTIDFSVSKGTYIRALVRDIGRELGCPAHVLALQRRQVGALELAECHSLESLEALGVQAAIDPARLLGFKLLFADEFEKQVQDGGKLSPGRARLFEFAPAGGGCPCTSTLISWKGELVPDELLSVIVGNRLNAVYRHDAARGTLVPDCVFSTPVARM